MPNNNPNICCFSVLYPSKRVRTAAPPNYARFMNSLRPEQVEKISLAHLWDGLDCGRNENSGGHEDMFYSGLRSWRDLIHEATLPALLECLRLNVAIWRPLSLEWSSTDTATPLSATPLSATSHIQLDHGLVERNIRTFATHLVLQGILQGAMQRAYSDLCGTFPYGCPEHRPPDTPDSDSMKQ